MSNLDYDNNEQYPYMSYWLKHRRIKEISLYDIRPKTLEYEPTYMLPLNRNKLIGTFTDFSKKVYLSAGDDEDDISVGDIHLRFGPKLIQEIVPALMQLISQVKRLTFKKSKYRSRRKIMQGNLKLKRAFLKSYSIGKITVEIVDDPEKSKGTHITPVLNAEKVNILSNRLISSQLLGAYNLESAPDSESGSSEGFEERLKSEAEPHL